MSLRNLIRNLQWVDRNLPFMTVAVAVACGAYSFFYEINTKSWQGLVILLFFMLSFNILLERVNLLEKIEHGVRVSKGVLRGRDDLEPPRITAANASTIHIMAISGIHVVSDFYSFYEEKLKNGCRLEVLLLDPFGSAVNRWEQQSMKSSSTAQNITSTLELLSTFSSYEGCQVRTMDMFPPFSMFGTDFGESGAKVIVEFHSYKLSPQSRPHIVVDRQRDPKWFVTYKEQFQKAWGEASEIDWVAFRRNRGVRVFRNTEEKRDIILGSWGLEFWPASFSESRVESEVAKGAQNILSFAVDQFRDLDKPMFANLMVYEEEAEILEIVMTHGFYYPEACSRVFPVGKSGEEGSCGVAFRESKVLIIPNVFEHGSGVSMPARAFENMGSLINIPLADKGVLNIDCPVVGSFVDTPELREKADLIRQLGEGYIGFREAALKRLGDLRRRNQA